MPPPCPRPSAETSHSLAAMVLSSLCNVDPPEPAACWSTPHSSRPEPLQSLPPLQLDCHKSAPAHSPLDITASAITSKASNSLTLKRARGHEVETAETETPARKARGQGSAKLDTAYRASSSYFLHSKQRATLGEPMDAPALGRRESARESTSKAQARPSPAVSNTDSPAGSAKHAMRTNKLPASTLRRNMPKLQQDDPYVCEARLREAREVWLKLLSMIPTKMGRKIWLPPRDVFMDATDRGILPCTAVTLRQSFAVCCTERARGGGRVQCTEFLEQLRAVGISFIASLDSARSQPPPPFHVPHHASQQDCVSAAATYYMGVPRHASPCSFPLQFSHGHFACMRQPSMGHVALTQAPYSATMQPRELYSPYTLAMSSQAHHMRPNHVMGAHHTGLVFGSPSAPWPQGFPQAAYYGPM